MKRKIDALLTSWILLTLEREQEGRHKCLLVRGLRQTGKSYAIRKALSLPEEDLTVIVSEPSFSGWVPTTAVEINFSLNPNFMEAFKKIS